MAESRFHEYTECVEKNFFVPVHEFIWDKYLVNVNLDGQTAFYYAMEYIHEHFPTLSAKLAFEIASDIMQEIWDIYLDRMQAEYEEKEKSTANNYEAWTEDDLPWM